ncbi:MAG: hypothetical protein L3J93_03270 [Thermoplasmata archaeon]|nr:hypothetical protein [Thermoplasmata archaeon]
MKVVPVISRFFQAVAGMTILFGFLLLLNMGGFGLLAPSTFYGVDLTIGVTLALAAFVSTEFVTVPLMRRAIRTLESAQAAGQHEPPSEFPRQLRRAALSSVVTVVLLLLTSVFMVGAGFY